MKLYFLFVLIIFSLTAKAQHCNWCFCCCNILIAEIDEKLVSESAQIYLVDNKKNVLLDINNDTIFLNSQRFPYKASKHKFFKRNDLPKNDTLIYNDFNDKTFYIAMIQICKTDSLCLLYEDKVKQVKKSIPILFDKFKLMCRSFIKIGKNNQVTFKEEYLKRLKSKIIKISL